LLGKLRIFRIAICDGQNARVQALTIENIAGCDTAGVDRARTAKRKVAPQPKRGGRCVVDAAAQ